MVDPIEPILITSKSRTKTIYSVSGNSTTTFAAPIGATSVTVYFGNTPIASDDENYPWTLDAAGNVVFTERAPRDGQIVTMVDNDRGLDLDKVQFPKGYNLDSRVFNRTLNSALDTVNDLWETGSDLFDAWRSQNNIPEPTTVDDQFAVTDNQAWQRQNKTQVGNTLEDELFGNIIATTGVSALNFSATTANIETIDSFSAFTPSSQVGPYVYRTLSFNPDNPTLSGGFDSPNLSGIIVDASSSIRFFDQFKEQINPSGFFNRNAASLLNNDLSYLTDNILTDNNNIVLSPGVYTQASKISSWNRITQLTAERNHVKAKFFPETCLRVSGSVVTDLDSYPPPFGTTVFLGNFYPNIAPGTPAEGTTQAAIVRPTIPTTAFTPSISYANFFCPYNTWDGTAPADYPNGVGLIDFIPAIFIRFGNSLITNEDYVIDIPDALYTSEQREISAKIKAAYTAKGYIKMKVYSGGTSVEFMADIADRFHPIGTIDYHTTCSRFFQQGIGTGLAQPWIGLPLNAVEEQQVGLPIFSSAIVKLQQPDDFDDYYFSKGTGVAIDRVEYEVEFVLYQNDTDIYN